MCRIKISNSTIAHIDKPEWKMKDGQRMSRQGAGEWGRSSVKDSKGCTNYGRLISKNKDVFCKWRVFSIFNWQIKYK